MWDSIFYFVMVPMVYIAFGVLIIGIFYKLGVIFLAPKIKGKLGIFPRTLPRPVAVLRDAFLAPSSFKKDKIFWFFIILFHAAFLLLFIGHLELIREFKILQIIPHHVFLGNGWVGIAIIVTGPIFRKSAGGNAIEILRIRGCIDGAGLWQTILKVERFKRIY